MPGTSTLGAEVTHVSRHGFWLLLGEEELMLPFAEFPWFKHATIDQLCEVEWPAPIISTGRNWMSICPWSPSAIPSAFR